MQEAPLPILLGHLSSHEVEFQMQHPTPPKSKVNPIFKQKAIL